MGRMLIPASDDIDQPRPAVRVRQGATAGIVTAKRPRDVLHAAQLPRCGAIARAARARAAEYHIVNVATDDCAEPDRTGTAMGAVQGGMFGAAMAVGLIACFFCDACGSLAVELDRIAAPRAAVAS